MLADDIDLLWAYFDPVMRGQVSFNEFCLNEASYSSSTINNLAETRQDTLVRHAKQERDRLAGELMD